MTNSYLDAAIEGESFLTIKMPDNLKEYEKIIAAAKNEDISLAAFQRKVLLNSIEDS